MKKAKVIRGPRTKVTGKKELIEHIQKMKAELEGAQRIITAMQAEIKQLTQMHRMQLETIHNLSSKIRDDR